MNSNEQKLIDMMFSIALAAFEWGKDSSRNGFGNIETIPEWVRYNLNSCGFPVEPIGSSHGVLKKD